MNQQTTSHTFAFFCSELGSWENNGTHTLTHELAHRILYIVRLTPGDTCILFNKHLHTIAHITLVTKRNVTVTYTALHKNTCFTPAITCVIPPLKKEAFEQALYSCVELGATTIQPLITEKAHFSARSGYVQERAEKILQAAAEQSKNFCLPELASITSLPIFLRSAPTDTVYIFFDPTGIPLSKLLVMLATHTKQKVTQKTTYTLIIGPEGDLTPHEKELLRAHNVFFCALTPTILRAQQALTIGLGIFRTVLQGDF